MSDVSKTIPELIAEARQFLAGESAQYYDSSLVRSLADALEAATRAPEQGEAVAAIGRVRAAIEEHKHWNELCGWDVPAIEVLAALDGAPEPEWEYGYELIEPDDRNVFERGGSHASAASAFREAKKRIEQEVAEGVPRLQYALIRRRKTGPWLPVEGESKP